MERYSLLKNTTIDKGKWVNKYGNDTLTSVAGKFTIQEKEQYSRNDEVNKEGLVKILMKDGVEHEEKIDLGANIYQILGEYNIK